MSEWKLYRLGDFLSINNDELVKIEPTEYYTISGVQNEGKGVQNKRTVLGSELTMKLYKKVKKNQLLWCKVDTRKGAFGITTKENENTFVSTNMHLADINTLSIDVAFLSYLFKRKELHNRIDSLSQGSTNRRYAKKEQIFDIEILLPPLPEQKRIVAKIESVKSKIEAIQKLRAEQEKEMNNLRYSIFEDLFNTYGDTEIGSLIIEDNDSVPVDPTKIYEFAGLYGFGNGLFVRGFQNGNDTTYKTFNRLHKNKLVMSQPKGWEGAITVIPDKFDGLFLSPVYSTFSSKETCNIKFVGEYCKMPTTWQKMLDVSKGIGARRNSIYPKDFLQISIPNVPIEEQNRIVDILEKANRIKEVHKEQEKELTELLPSLLDKAFKGEL